MSDEPAAKPRDKCEQLAPHRWKPGQSGNPGGRSQGLERRVRELVDFDKITLALQDIALGKLPPGITGETTVKIKDRIEAAKILYDRGHGKARAIVDMTKTVNEGGLGAINVDALDEAAFAMLEQAVQAALGSATVDTRKVIAAHAVERPDPKKR